MTDSRLQRLLRSPVVWPLAGLALLLAVNFFHNPAFFHVELRDGHLFGAPVDIFNQGARTFVVALGMTLVIATGGVDLSVGSVMAVAGAAAGLCITSGHTELPLVLSVALGAGAVAGLLNGVLVAYAGVQPIVATLILMVSGRGIAQFVAHGDVLLIKHPSFEFLGKGFLVGLPFAAVLAVALYGAAHFALRRTAAGLFVEAVGDNPIASRFAGLATARVKCLAYLGCGLCAALAGAMDAANIAAADPYRSGENMELDAIFAVVVGGTALTGGRFTLAGTFAGVLLLKTLEPTLIFLGVPPPVAPVPKALLILAVCVLQSDRAGRWLRGLWPRKEAAPLVSKVEP
jgi:ribose/xylose/arabinose/galactoside ABC-type transport system permease subunit